jgi:hypothetical protein
MEIAATRLGVLFDRSAAVKLSGMSEKAYIRSYNSLHNGIGVKLVCFPFIVFFFTIDFYVFFN